MLRDCRLSIGQIAWRLGYASQANFCCVFRRLKDMRPRGCRHN